MRVVVLGAGALGSVYGAWLTDAGADVTLVARRPHAVAVSMVGGTLVGPGVAEHTFTPATYVGDVAGETP